MRKTNYGVRPLAIGDFVSTFIMEGNSKYDAAFDSFLEGINTKSHRDASKYFYNMELYLVELIHSGEAYQVIDDLKEERIKLEKEIKDMKNIDELMIAKNKINDIDCNMYFINHATEILFICENFRRVSNAEVKKDDVLTGNVYEVIDGRKHYAYYRNPLRYCSGLVQTYADKIEHGKTDSPYVKKLRLGDKENGKY